MKKQTVVMLIVAAVALVGGMLLTAFSGFPKLGKLKAASGAPQA